MLLSIRDDVDGDEQLKQDMIEGSTNFLEAVDQAASRLQELRVYLDALKSAREEMDARIERFKAQEERIRAALLVGLGAVDMKKCERPIATISVRAGSPQVVIRDENKVPTSYYVEQAPKLDKKKVNEDVKAGVKVPGTELVTGDPAVSIRFK